MTIMYKNWDSLNGDEKVAMVECKRQLQNEHHDSEYDAYMTFYKSQRKRIKKHVKILWEMRKKA